MNSRIRKFIGLLLGVCFLLCGIFPVYGEEEAADPARELHISNEEELLAFAQHCRLDSYSQDLIVYLDADIHITDADFTGIPIFCGTLYGNRHTISGFSLTQDGSVQGFFRYLTETAHIHNLILRGNVLPQGSRKTIGGLAGTNAGTIERCSFEGQVAGNDRVGGLVGTNTVTGVIETCCTSGSIQGNHFVGGVTGENYGTVRNSINMAKVNITVKDNQVDLSDVTMESLSGTESANTVTDLGGIAGTSSGVIRDCENRAAVGYSHIGYNIGGIVGSQQGYVTTCKNFGDISGRKDVGGIVGQMEPVSKIEYTIDTLQILQEQLASTSDLATQASFNAQNSASAIGGQISVLHDQAEIAKDAVNQLIPDPDHPELPDADRILAAKNTLTGSIDSMQGAMQEISSTTQNAASVLSQDIQNIANQLHSMTQTINNASEYLGGNFQDVSDTDTSEDLTGKLEQCVNSGSVTADLNAGGIAGAIALENDLDPEDDWKIIGDQSLNFESELRAVILDCKNTAAVTVKKRNAGGIAGKMSLGLVKGCANTGTLLAENAEYVGGIAGVSTGYLRNNSAKCELYGTVYVGGIAGSGRIATDCASMVSIHDGTEKLGAILGIVESGRFDSEQQVQNNFYLAAEQDCGGIDGISYAGSAEPLPPEQFFARSEGTDIFSKATVTFLFEDGSYRTRSVSPGEGLNPSQIPAIPEKAGYTAEWENLEDTDLSSLYFDLTFRPVYTPCQVTIQSDTLRDDSIPLLLAQGEFPQAETFQLEPMETLPVLPEPQKALEGWTIPQFSQDTDTQLRFAFPKEQKADSLKLLVQDQDGTWRETDFQVSGSYLVFSVHPSENAFCLVHNPSQIPWWVYAGAGVFLAAIVVTVIVVAKKKRKKRKAPKETDQTPTNASSD